MAFGAGMKLKTLSSTGQAVPELGFGCWQLGGRGWGSFDEREGIAAVHCALDHGVRLFDTAPVYGFGLSERRLGKALVGRDDAIVITKGGLVPDADRRVVHDNRPESLKRQLEESLVRLGRETVDLFILHWPDPAVPLGESLAALECLRRDGMIRSWGLSNFSAGDVSAAAKAAAGPGLVQVPLNLLGWEADDAESRQARQVHAAARRLGWDTIAFDVLARGLLGGTWTPATRFGKRDIRSRDSRFHEPRFSAYLARVQVLTTAAAELGVPTAALAIRGLLEKSESTACLIGMRTPAQVKENVRAATLEVPPELLNWLT